jgi:hypothetical protein
MFASGALHPKRAPHSVACTQRRSGAAERDKTEDRDYWHIVIIQDKLGRYVLRLLGGKDGPDLTACNIGSAAKATVSTQSCQYGPESKFRFRNSGAHRYGTSSFRYP